MMKSVLHRCARRQNLSKQASTSLGIDGWAPREISSADDAALQDLVNIYKEIETKLCWPIQTMLNIVVLMGKPRGGGRRCGDGSALASRSADIASRVAAAWAAAGRGSSPSAWQSVT